jgi:hypothetical protein
MERANVNGHVFLDDLRAKGMLSLVRATIGAIYNVWAATFPAPKSKTSSSHPLALARDAPSRQNQPT